MKHKLLILGFLGFLALMVAAPTAEAQSSHNVDYYHTDLEAITGVVKASNVDTYISYPDVVSTHQDENGAIDRANAYIGLFIDGPVPFAGTATYSTTVTSTSDGCDVSRITFAGNANSRSEVWSVLLTDSVFTGVLMNDCHFMFQVIIQIGSTTVYTALYAVNFHVDNPVIDWEDVAPNARSEFQEAITLFFPLLIFLAVVVWAERTQEPLIYVLAVITAIFMIIGLWDSAAVVRLSLLGVVLMVALRGILAAINHKNEIHKAYD